MKEEFKKHPLGMIFVFIFVFLGLFFQFIHVMSWGSLEGAVAFNRSILNFIVAFIFYWVIVKRK